MIIPILYTLAFQTSVTVLAFPSYTRDEAQGVVITPPPRPTDTGMKQIPDAEHPYQAPGSSDQRGPCPGLNTLANHGYIPRNGIATYEQIILAVAEGYNMAYDFASFITAFGMLARGNAYTNQLSIGGASSLVPPLPGKIDGDVTKGLSGHGRFEGDVSMTRKSSALGDNSAFDPGLFDEFVALVHKYGDDSPVTGPKSVVNYKTMGEYKYQRFLEEMNNNPKLDFQAARLYLSYDEAAFILTFFPNGTNALVDIPTVTSFLRDNAFPKNWNRRSSPGSYAAIINAAAQIVSPHPISPGKKGADGKYVVTGQVTPCTVYTNMVRDNLPASLMSTSGTLKKNVDTLLRIIYVPFASSCPYVTPNGPAGA